MNKCMAADIPCTCQPTAGNVCADVMALRKDAERYRFLRDVDGAFEAFTAAYYNAEAPADIDSAIDSAIATDGAAVGAA